MTQFGPNVNIVLSADVGMYVVSKVRHILRTLAFMEDHH